MRWVRIFGFTLLFLYVLRVPMAASDFQWTFEINGLSDYRLAAVSSTQIYAGSLPALDPTINLIADKRYAVTVTDPISHPLQIIAVGGAGDTVLLAQGGMVGTFEGDGGVQWDDNGSGTVEFTVSSNLLSAFTQGGATAGYRCTVHTLDMRGAFALFGNGTPIANPIVATIPKGGIAIELEPVIEDLVSPLGLTQPDDGTNRLFVHDQNGEVWVVQNGAALATPFLDVGGRLVSLNSGYDERGLLGFAMHPNFAANPKVYTYTSEPVAGTADFTFPGGSTPNHQSVVAEWQVSGTNTNLIDPGTRRELLRIDQPQSNHNGGAMHFGADGMLYIALGDGGSAADLGSGHSAQGNGQDITNVYGSILRIDVDGNNSANGDYGVPAGNPFVGVTGVDEIWAYGLRNPYSFGFDEANGDLYAGDVGQGDIEEIDRIVGGDNFGWRLKEGSFFFDPDGSFVTTVPVEPLPAGLIDPVAEYDHDEGVSVICATVYRGSRIPGLAGRLVFGDFSNGATGRLFHGSLAGEIQEFVIGTDDRDLGGFLKGLGRDQAGEVYACVSGSVGPSGSSGAVYRLVPLTNARVPWALYR